VSGDADVLHGNGEISLSPFLHFITLQNL